MAVEGGKRGGVAGGALRSALSADLARISWAAIFAGAICALGLQALFTLLTLGLGLELVSDGDPSGAGWGTGLFFALTAIASLFAGGWIAARLSGMPLKPSAILHGVVVWAVTTIAAIWLSISVTGAVINTATQALSTAGSAVASVAGTAAQGVAGAASAVLPEIEDLQIQDFQAVIPQSIEQDINQLLEGQDLTPQQITQEVREVTNAVIDRSELRQARSILVSSGRRMIRNPGQADEIFQTAIDRLTQEGGPLGEGQFDELQGILQERYGVDADQANQIAERWQSEFVEARDALVSTYRDTYDAVAQELNQAVQAAEDAAQRFAEGAASAAWWSAFGLILGLIAAAGGAAMGRPDDVATADANRY